MTDNYYLEYLDYTGSVSFSKADSVFHGRVIGIKPLISYEGDTVNAAADFHNAVDERPSNEYASFPRYAVTL